MQQIEGHFFFYVYIGIVGTREGVFLRPGKIKRADRKRQLNKYIISKMPREVNGNPMDFAGSVFRTNTIVIPCETFRLAILDRLWYI
jgi:hypothetical protein